MNYFPALYKYTEIQSKHHDTLILQLPYIAMESSTAIARITYIRL